MTKLEKIKSIHPTTWGFTANGFDQNLTDHVFWLIARIERLEAALMFYADPYGQADLLDDADYLPHPEHEGDFYKKTGKRAREALAEE